ncbi:MAG: phosphoribosylformylglycinamidine synthase I [Planctomycetota bacterium]|nr:phosphoribosylformylglycinamidine synthase I [Planctomycetota bacterium]
MSQPSVLLLRTAGTNCDEETRFAFERAGATVEAVHVRRLGEAPALLDAHAILVLPGGFSYGDDLGSGVVLAHEITRRLAEPFARFVERGGLAIGICNGFQVLVKTGLLPGPSYRSESNQSAIRNSQSAIATADWAATLTFNDSQRFEDRWVRLEVAESSSPFLTGQAGRHVTFPVAHGEGKFVARDKATLQRIVDSRQVAFRYAGANGAKPQYPENPNGSQADIAGITDETGRVLGLMPHPERHALPWQHPRWTREGLAEDGEGMFLFRNAVTFARS